MPDNSALDISELPNRTFVTTPSLAQEEETDLSRLHTPNDGALEPLLELTFEILPVVSDRMKPKLVDSHNYTYNIKGQLKDGTNWQCSVRNKETYCKDMVKQKGSQFTHSPQPYTCMPQAPTLPAAKARAQITKEAMTHRFQLAATIVNQTRLEHLPSTAPTCALPKIDRQASHPSYPSSLDLQLQEDALPENFLQEDIRFNDRRHFAIFLRRCCWLCWRLPKSQLNNYVKNTWISSNIWFPSSRPIYNRLICTNEVKGWHRL